MTKKPLTLTIKDFSKTVQDAVAKRATHPEFEIHFGPILMGIIFRAPLPTTDEANEIATSITEQVGANQKDALAIKLEPAVLIRPGGPIICGFLPENISIRG